MDGEAAISQSNLNVVGFAVARRLGLLVGQAILRAEAVRDVAKKRHDIVGALWEYDAAAGGFRQLFHSNVTEIGSFLRIEVGVQRDEIVWDSAGSNVAQELLKILIHFRRVIAHD